jgi:hypothetical protein
VVGCSVTFICATQWTTRTGRFCERPTGTSRRQCGHLRDIEKERRIETEVTRFSRDLPIAPLEHQRRFAELAVQIRSVQQDTARARASASFEALLARVLGRAAGEKSFEHATVGKGDEPR